MVKRLRMRAMLFKRMRMAQRVLHLGASLLIMNWLKKKQVCVIGRS